MGLFSFKQSNFEKQKNLKFKELESQYFDNIELLNSIKAAWLTSRGNNFGLQNELDMAIKDFKEAIELNPNHIPAHEALGIAYREKKMFQSALDVLNNAPKKLIISGRDFGDAQLADIYSDIGSVYYAMGDKKMTIEFAKKTLSALDSHDREEYIKESNLDGNNMLLKRDVELREILEELIKELEEK